MFRCLECGLEKEDSDYYKAYNKRGLTTKCKSCIKSRVTKHREENLEKIRLYDRNRPNHKERVEKGKERYKEKRKSGDESFLEKDRERTREYRIKNPLKYQAHNCVNNALRDGKLTRPDSCNNCGKLCKPQAHHWSYEQAYWLDVVWLCIRCHADEHKKLRSEGRDPDLKQI